MVLEKGVAQRPGWKLDEELLGNQVYCEKIEKVIKEYVGFNRTGEVSKAVVWVSLKAVVRGEVILFKARVDKEERLERQRVIDEMLEVVRSYAEDGGPAKLEKRKEPQASFDRLSTRKAVRQLR
ncbi:hypothetical protein scyTo_0000560 [Scyliorhinus torazame]|uniref:Uncharacterized protein n=1 Tax=Scyliorhinus torazame TaxID=75743 RepID=A0A401NZ94_SCYTO|nr:hypothetical protein [Scyliorhinus torazame]